MKKTKIKISKSENSKTEEPIYKVLLTMNNEKSEYFGNDLREMIGKFTPPDIIKSETSITAIKGDKTITKDMRVYDAKRLFGKYTNKTALTLFIDNLIEQLG